MIKHPPSLCGEFESGCHGPDANNWALIALSCPEHIRHLEYMAFPKWEEAINDMQTRTLNTDREVLEKFSLGWLLANEGYFFNRVFEDSLSSVDPEDPKQLEQPNPGETRDWFCWLHREMISRAREHQLQKQNEQRQYGCIGA